MFKHLKNWNSWIKKKLNDNVHKILVIVGLEHSPAFKIHLNGPITLYTDKITLINIDTDKIVAEPIKWPKKGDKNE